MKKKTKISTKVTKLLLITMLLFVLLYSMVSVWGLNTIKQISFQSNQALGKTATEEAKSTLQQLAKNQLEMVAIEKAAYIEEKFLEVSSYVHGIAAMSETIYNNPEIYPDREVSLSKQGDAKLFVQLLKARGLKDITSNQNKELLKLANIQDLLLQYNANNQMVSSTYVATTSGWLIQADTIAYRKFNGKEIEPNFYEANTRQWYQKAIKAKEGEMIYSDIIADVNGGGDYIVCAQPIYHNGEIVAVAGVGTYLDTIYDTVFHTNIGNNGYAFLINKHEQVIMSPMTEGETAVKGKKGTDLLKITKDMVTGKQGFEKVKIDGKEVYLAYAPLEKLGWSIAAVIDVKEVIAPAKKNQDMILKYANLVEEKQKEAIGNMLIFFLVLTISLATLIGIFGAIFGRKITRPIRMLTSEVEKVGKGKIDYDIHIETGDEIEELGNAFQYMTFQIRSYIKNLSQCAAEKERIKTELSVASKLQAEMLPEPFCAFPNRTEFSLWAQMTPARQVGGDFYDFFMADDDHLVFLVADVSGKGIPSALFMVAAKTMIRNCMKGDFGLAQALTNANNNLCKGNENSMFVTAWIGVLTLSTGNLIYVNAGHNPPLFKSGDHLRYLNQRTGFVLGGMEDATYGQAQLRLMPGDGLFLYSDGVTEINNTNKLPYGEIRLKQKLEKFIYNPPREQVSAIWKDIQVFKGEAEPFDDITMLALRYKGIDYHKMTGSADISRKKEIEQFIESVLEKEEVSRSAHIKMQIAVDEIFSNICRYSKAREVTIACRVANGKIRLYFEDDGIPFSPLENPDPDVTDEIELRKVGGYGIYIVKKSIDSITYEFQNGKNRLFLMKII